ncbi:MAG: glutathione peroxidase [Lachnospiraceae bacterium]|nr:glutathione peroxidase [Lachnospiraceae bacterium]
MIADVNIYSIKVPNMDGTITDLSAYKEKVLLVVNTATGCGFTPQYEALEKIYREYKEKGLRILDFPCDQFGSQAHDTISEIHSFCTARYDISFDQFAKIDVNGKNEIELYTYLKKKQGFHGFGDSLDANYMRKKLAKEVPGYEETTDIKWNFTKFLINRQGEVIARFEPTEDMDLVEAAVKEAME